MLCGCVCEREFPCGSINYITNSSNLFNTILFDSRRKWNATCNSISLIENNNEDLWQHWSGEQMLNMQM